MKLAALFASTLISVALAAPLTAALVAPPPDVDKDCYKRCMDILYCESVFPSEATTLCNFRGKPLQLTI